jgi:hypothetical protein
VEHIDRFEGSGVAGNAAFVYAFVLSLCLNWVGFLAAYTYSGSTSGRCGAMSGFGLSLIKVCQASCEGQPVRVRELRIFVMVSSPAFSCICYVRRMQMGFLMRQASVPAPILAEALSGDSPKASADDGSNGGSYMPVFTLLLILIGIVMFARGTSLYLR